MPHTFLKFAAYACSAGIYSPPHGTKVCPNQYSHECAKCCSMGERIDGVDAHEKHGLVIGQCFTPTANPCRRYVFPCLESRAWAVL